MRVLEDDEYEYETVTEPTRETHTARSFSASTTTLTHNPDGENVIVEREIDAIEHSTDGWTVTGENRVHWASEYPGADAFFSYPINNEKLEFDPHDATGDDVYTDFCSYATIGPEAEVNMVFHKLMVGDAPQDRIERLKDMNIPDE